MRDWLRNLHRATVRVQPRQPVPAPFPRLEALEDRCLLQGSPLTHQGFVTQLYRDVLKREPDQGGLMAWSGMLDSGQSSRAQVAQAFVNSVEYQMAVVQGFYGVLLHRTADLAGLNAWTNFLAQGGTQPQLEAQFLGSDEYYLTRGGGTANGYLQALYQDVLNRQIDPVGLKLDTAFLSGNDILASRTAVASEVINSQDGGIVTIDRLYSEFLHRAPDSGGMSAFLAGFQANQDPSGSGVQNQGTGNNVSGSQTANDDPAQAAIIPAGLKDPSGGNGDPSNSGPTSGLTLEQAMVVILSSPEYFALADR